MASKSAVAGNKSGEFALEDSIVELAKSGRLAKAGSRAFQQHLDAGGVVVYMHGRQIVMRNPDGKLSFIATIKTPRYKLPAGVKVIKKK